jgi:hypothetical protein
LAVENSDRLGQLTHKIVKMFRVRLALLRLLASNHHGDHYQGFYIKSDKKVRGEMVEAFIAELGKQDGVISEFNERLWHSLLDYATIHGDEDVRFIFKNGLEIQA